MAKRGRKSAADLSVVAFESARRPAPPDDLNPEQRAEWEAIVDRMPADWFDAPSQPLLADYCRHVVRARFLSATLDNCPSDGLTTTEGLDHYNKLAAAAERETRAALACARALRLTQQSRYDAAKAARRVASEPTGPKPWEV